MSSADITYQKPNITRVVINWENRCLRPSLKTCDFIKYRNFPRSWGMFISICNLTGIDLLKILLSNLHLTFLLIKRQDRPVSTVSFW